MKTGPATLRLSMTFYTSSRAFIITISVNFSAVSRLSLLRWRNGRGDMSTALIGPPELFLKAT
ncbi:hypothetical protein BJX76DRAFT_249929 [Aspergillus varians]